jgi:hypothetical protein
LIRGVRANLCVEWHLEFPDEPVELLSEIDEASMETRKVERFRGGHLGYADAHRNLEPTELAYVPMPDLDEIAEDPQFRPRRIARDEFERVWEAAQSAHRAGSTDG